MNSDGQAGILFVLGAICLIFLRPAVRSALSDPARFPAVRWRWPEGVFIGGIVGFFLLMAAASAGRGPVTIDLRSIFSSLALYGAIVVLVIGFLIGRGMNPIAAFGLRWTRWRTEWHCIPVALLLCFPYIYLAQWAAYQISGPDASPQAIVTFLLENSGWRERLAVAAIAVVAAPLTEEIIFRGCLYGISRQFAGRLPAIFFSAVVFALIHGHLPSLPGLLVLSIALCLVYERTGSLWSCIGLHALFNGLTVIAAVYWPDLAK